LNKLEFVFGSPAMHVIPLRFRFKRKQKKREETKEGKKQSESESEIAREQV